MAAPVTIELSEPIFITENGMQQQVSHLVLMPPKARHLRKFSPDDFKALQMDMLLNLAAKLAGITPEEIDELNLDDTFEVIGAIGDFFQPPAGTGAKPS